jgi:protoporphyrinogen oxidase
LQKNRWENLEKKSAIPWIRGWVGNETYRLLWEPLLHHKFHQYAETISASWLWARIRRVGKSRSFFWGEKFGYIEGGTVTLLNALRQEIESRGGKVYLKTPVRRIIPLEDGKIQITTDREIKSYSRVISTVPIPVVKRILFPIEESFFHKWDTIPYLSVLCIILQLRKQVTPYFWLYISDKSMDIPGWVEYSNLNPTHQHILYIPYYLPENHPILRESPPSLVNKILSYIQKINPSISESDLLQWRVHFYPYAQAVCSSNFLAQLPPYKIRPNLLVADTSYYYPEDRSINESIRYGRKLAQEILSF